jgi:hypothetical protein
LEATAGESGFHSINSNSIPLFFPGGICLELESVELETMEFKMLKFSAKSGIDGIVFPGFQIGKRGNFFGI